MGRLNLYLVCYDISDPDRLRKVHTIMKGFGHSLQYSVFTCHLSKQGKTELIASLDKTINHQEDRIMIVNLGPVNDNTQERFTFLGCRPSKRDRKAVII
ncbi:MAG: CRISPR-associated endonuclease Cas2 [Candidatus Korarchaeota archaeon]|nr:CRISPR-associated endonuclease Cas2 [Candidatus Korarchaeota archaeon]NIU83249.1 CRISPR-associated endonuclease Cas2 [Candidatus Thorarchaeota archaeon]NIW13594.1 CRISPR-associated endonuclease Cas2 [Candidatus Thorarchaeota archaeon]NIW51696.1 CRISPR-associated endonuclease Cas2 [Candidatus Korarchaeota archaeon]